MHFFGVVLQKPKLKFESNNLSTQAWESNWNIRAQIKPDLPVIWMPDKMLTESCEQNKVLVLYKLGSGTQIVDL